MRWAQRGPAYVPFIGDGDICVGGSRPGALPHERYALPGLYGDRSIFGADLDEARVRVARARIPTGDIRVANCDGYPFSDRHTGPIAIADFDAWTDPYKAANAFWAHAEKADRLVMFFTDAHKMGIAADGTLIRPDGSKTTFRPGVDLHERQRAFNLYFAETIWPWFTDFIEPYRVLEKMRYLRGQMLYWGAAIEKPKQGGPMARGKLSNFGSKKAPPFKAKAKPKPAKKTTAKKK